MKTSLIILLTIFSSIGYGQNDTITKSYVYLTYDEYIKNKPSVIIDHDNNDNINFTVPGGLFRVKTKVNNEKTIYKPGDIWGYKKRGELYRFYDDYKQKELDWEWRSYFKIIYDKEITIYQMYNDNGYNTAVGGNDPLTMVLSLLVSSVVSSAISEGNYTYFYSHDANSKLKVLTKENLALDYTDTPETIELIKEKINSNNQ